MTTGSARALLRRLGVFMDGFSACFSRQPQRDAASRYLDGLFNASERKSMQAKHGRLSDSSGYQAPQHFITHSPWDAARGWTQLRATVPVMASSSETPCFLRFAAAFRGSHSNLHPTHSSYRYAAVY